MFTLSFNHHTASCEATPRALRRLHTGIASGRDTFVFVVSTELGI